MRLLYSNLNLELDLKDDISYILVVENVDIFSNIIESLGKQVSGREGQFLLSDGERELKIERRMEFIMNPFALTANDKKILNAIYSELRNISLEKYEELLAKVNSEIITFIDQLNQNLPYSFLYDLNLDPIGIFKLYDVKMEEEYSDLADRIISCIKLRHQILGINLFVFVNLKHFVSKTELEFIYEACRYEHVCFLDIEGLMPKFMIKHEKYVIIDSDLCIIDLSN